MAQSACGAPEGGSAREAIPLPRKETGHGRRNADESRPESPALAPASRFRRAWRSADEVDEVRGTCDLPRGDDDSATDRE